MIVTAILIGLASASTPAAAAAVAPCGLEEVPVTELRVCPPQVTYDEEGEEVGGEAGQASALAAASGLNA